MPATNSSPPSAGPPMIAPCMPAELNAIARDSSSGGTKSGVSACCAGIWKARTAPSTSDSPSSSPRVSFLCSTAKSSASATVPCTAKHTATMRAR
ncbi:hypothetical protein D3C72_1150720 [compost metagenome]